MTPRVLIVGGGVTGLAAAHRLRERAPDIDCQLWEAGPRLGGVLETVARDGLLIERSADMFTTKESWALDLCRRLGLAERLIGTNERLRKAFIVWRGRLTPVPAGFTLMAPGRLWPIAASPLLTWRGKLRMAREWLAPRRPADAGDESLADFARRRCGREAYERLIQPLVGGIYTADPERLSMQAALPQFVDMERKYGGLMRGLRAQQQAQRRTRAQQGGDAPDASASGARYGLFVAPAGGMQELIDALVARLPAASLHTHRAVQRLAPRDDGRWDAYAAGDEPPATFDAVIVALAAHRAAAIVRPFADDLASSLAQIPYASAAVVVDAYRRDDIEHPCDGFGAVVPQVERRRILAISFASNKFPGRAPDDMLLVRTFVGGALQPELADLHDERLGGLVDGELHELLGVRAAPRLRMIVRWPRAMPQYHVGHRSLVERIEHLAARWPTLALAGNAYRGVGIPYCVQGGEAAAERIVGLTSASAE